MRALFLEFLLFSDQEDFKCRLMRQRSDIVMEFGVTKILIKLFDKEIRTS